MSAQGIGAGSGLSDWLRLATDRGGESFARRNDSTSTGRVQGDSTPVPERSRTLGTVSVADALALSEEARALAAAAADGDGSSQLQTPEVFAETDPAGSSPHIRNANRSRLELRQTQSRTAAMRNLKPLSALVPGPGRLGRPITAAGGAGVGVGAASVTGRISKGSVLAGGVVPENLQATLDWLEGADPGLHRDLLVLLKTLGNEEDAARILRGARRIQAARSADASGASGAQESPESRNESGVASLFAGRAPEGRTVRAEFEAGLTIARVEVTQEDGNAEAMNLQLVEVEGRIEIRLVFGDPLVLDLAGDGIDLRPVEGGAEFDISGTGRSVQTAFVQGDDAFLFLDADGDGRLTDGRELFGDQEGDAHGFAELARYDGNGDGVIDPRDAVWSELRLYQDVDGDGRVGAHETRTLRDAGVASLGLAYTDAHHTDRHGNRLAQAGAFTRADGSRGALVDALLLHAR